MQENFIYREGILHIPPRCKIRQILHPWCEPALMKSQPRIANLVRPVLASAHGRPPARVWSCIPYLWDQVQGAELEFFFGLLLALIYMYI